MRVVLAAANPNFAEPIARQLHADGQLVAVVRPARTFERLRRLWSARRSALDPLQTLVRAHGIPIVGARGDAGLAHVLDRFRADVFLMATFPSVVGAVPLAVPRLASLNIHPSLLPRHRGPNPWFWHYHRNDRTTGVCIHAVTSRVDAGPLLGRAELPLDRGYSVTRLQGVLAGIAAPMVKASLAELSAGNVGWEPQDERLATSAPRVQSRARMVDFAAWPAERVWHFLHGLFPKFREQLSDARGESVDYAGVGTWRSEAPPVAAGTVTPTEGGWLLWCMDGAVELYRAV